MTRLARLLLLALLPLSTAFAQEGFIGEVRLFAGNFAPRGWAFCQGQLLPINSNQALFSILGTTYGGDGRTTFALPDLRDRVPSHPSSTTRLGQKVSGSSGGSGGTSAVNVKLSVGVAGKAIRAWPGSSPKGTISVPRIGAKPVRATVNVGGGGSTPRLGLNYIVCLQGIFPSRS